MHLHPSFFIYLSIKRLIVPCIWYNIVVKSIKNRNDIRKISMIARQSKEVKKTIILTLIGITLSCLAMVTVKQNKSLSAKAEVTNYLAKRHYKLNEIAGVLSNAVKNNHNMYEDTY